MFDIPIIVIILTSLCLRCNIQDQPLSLLLSRRIIIEQSVFRFLFFLGL